ncbi:MAG: Shikimate dehydrogenase substrate binding domain protein [Bacteroidota bacterium]|nr:Shikimate dehydrogenase substrate binding domain protein [Bacteroidota bacterium]
MKQFGLIGYPLSHSFSENYFKEKFVREKITDAVYKLYPLEKIEDFILLCEKEKDLVGLNVTIPYKEKILPFLDGLHHEAEKIGAVNTIKFMNGKKIGYNTDIYGFKASLQPLLKRQHKHALILGTGGAAKAVAYVLNELAISFQYVSRTKSKEYFSYEELNAAIMDRSKLIINTSPVGMYPQTEEAPAIPYEFITREHLLYDLIYNPEETRFLKLGKEKGAQIKNGLEMLRHQAEKSWLIWNDK